MNTPLISVIVPVYNVEKYLPRCIDSILNQTYKNLEIILVDDGSPDNCPAICDEYAQKDSRIKVIHKANGGVSSARNVGLDVATGEYIGFVDSDDWIEPDMYEFLFMRATDYNVDISRCASVWEYGKGRCEEILTDNENENMFLLDGEDLILDLVNGAWDEGVVWNKLYKKEIVKNVRFREDIAFCEDCLFNYYVFKSNCDIKEVCSNTMKYHYLQKDAPDISKRDFDRIVVDMEMLNDEIDNYTIKQYCTKRLVEFSVSLFNGSAFSGLFKEKTSMLVNVIRDHKREVFSNDIYSCKVKIEVLFICYLLPIYKLILNSYFKMFKNR